MTINYRLGMFGFLAHPSLDKEGHAKANYGQMDQNQALRWVHENIGSFGGDASNVTIAGESSGGTSVIAQVLSPWSKGLFQNAIEMSGAAMMLKEPNFGAVTTLATAQRKGEDFAKAVGCNDPETAPACLRALDPSQVLAKQEPYLLAQTVIDGEFLPDWPSKLIETGNFNRVKLVSGNTLDEGDFFVALPELASGKPLTKEAYPVAIRGFHGEERAEAVLKQYPLSNYLNPSEAFSSTVTDYLFACPGLRLRDMATAHTDVWSYEFSDRTSPSYAPPVSFDLRAAHTFELPYIFPGFHGGKAGLPVALNPMQEGLASRMQAYWSSVAEAEKWKDWPGFKGENRLINQFALSGSQTISSDQFARTHHCDFWNVQKVY